MTILHRAMTLACVTAVMSGVIGAPASAGATAEGPILLTGPTGVWIDGQARWVTLSWTSRTAITDVTVTVHGSDGVQIGYEDPRLGHAELSVDSMLSTNEVDTTSFFVDPVAASGASFELDVVISWWDQDVPQQWSTPLRFSQRNDQGEAFLLLTEQASVPAGGDGSLNWVSLEFLGLDEDLRDVTVSIEGPLPVYYPQNTFTSLHHDSVLRADERDVARFWLDPARIESGDYELIVVVDFVVGERDEQQLRSPLQVRVG